MAEPMGFFTDTTVCIGCKACEVACKEWNQLPSTNGGANTLSGLSYDNTRALDGMHWRHVKFIEQFDAADPNRTGGRWLMMSDVCKHYVQAGCLEVSGLRSSPQLPSHNRVGSPTLSVPSGLLVGLLSRVAFRRRPMAAAATAASTRER